ncbi:HNH endonuclease signature motif containing protein [Pigmentiphaga aceris]|uniref:HNH endonuclease signature motif containing protein n=1 Tax=Pigmentiphaga aceris TaxID=1940612 RepID=UPI001651DC31|nr:HNH endonuclease signature motif containing protein [Pigmentiphaga aceris]
MSKLFGLAAGRCSICKEPVVKHRVKIGEMAHIIAKNTGGARGDLPFNGHRDDYENLILLCPNHHTEVDNDEANYPPEKLHRLKNEHEYYVSQVFKHRTQARSMDIGALVGLMRYLPLIQTPALVDGLPAIFNMNLFTVEEVCENFGKDFPHCRPFFDSHLEGHFYAFWSDLCHLNNYVRATSYNHSALYKISNGDFKNLHISRKLTYEQRQEVNQDIEDCLNKLLKSYDGLLQFLKYNYQEVHLASFIG